ncbi:HDL042Cp [Eremothecium sinecaudum]|uniref:HDL042Cp n=1 Tax=Eremothecium sinecaudum TaxID=45286 RepID=A0A109UX29_9SACH|nr:HDL042Cp [Eremothecium sinecaudum]AMD20702.1 HDL042Cp [Eremothecium sinecaudum]
MSATGRVSSDENSTTCGRKDPEVKKHSANVLGVPRKALGSVAVNTKKLQTEVTKLEQSEVPPRSPKKRPAVYHDSDSEEEEEPQEVVTKKQKADQRESQLDTSPVVHDSDTATSDTTAITDNVKVIQEPFPHKDLDSLEADDVTMCVEYTNDIFAHLLELEKTTTCEHNYVQDKQFPRYIRPSMRAILVDWLIEVHLKFQLLPEALYLAINIMDRYLSTNSVSLSRLQLVAITSLLIAAKFEEVNLPKLSNYAYITDNAYTTDEIKTAECHILNSLEFNIGWPNPMNFLRRISKADNYNHRTRNFAKVFLEYAMCSPKFLDTTPSVLAAIAMYCAMELTYGKDKFTWDETFDWYSSMATKSPNYNFHEKCEELIQEIREPSTQLNAFTYKYKKMGVWDSVKKWCDNRSTSKE